MRRISREGIDLNKLSIMTILSNAAQIVSAVFIAVILIVYPELFSSLSMKILLISVLIVITAGALFDIQEAFKAKKLDRHADMLKDSIDNLVFLNTEMRKQRHDFLNHLQVIYSLLELEESKEAIQYIEKVHSDLNRIGKTLKTDHPAINALIAAKANDAEETGIAFTAIVSSSLSALPLSAFEVCRALSNLIDNAFDALIGQPDGVIRVSFEENASQYRLTVSNNGPAIDPESLEKIFNAGYSSKGTDRGMGLAIVTDIAKSGGGALYVDSTQAITKFIIELPKKTA